MTESIENAPQKKRNGSDEEPNENWGAFTERRDLSKADLLSEEERFRLANREKEIKRRIAEIDQEKIRLNEELEPIRRKLSGDFFARRELTP